LLAELYLSPSASSPLPTANQPPTNHHRARTTELDHTPWLNPFPSTSISSCPTKPTTAMLQYQHCVTFSVLQALAYLVAAWPRSITEAAALRGARVLINCIGRLLFHPNQDPPQDEPPAGAHPPAHGGDV